MIDYAARAEFYQEQLDAIHDDYCAADESVSRYNSLMAQSEEIKQKLKEFGVFGGGAEKKALKSQLHDVEQAAKSIKPSPQLTELIAKAEGLKEAIAKCEEAYTANYKKFREK